MSDRSAKLLLEVAAALELADSRQHGAKMAGNRDAPLSGGLWTDIMTWARGYRQHLETKQRRRSSCDPIPEGKLTAVPEAWVVVEDYPVDRGGGDFFEAVLAHTEEVGEGVSSRSDQYHPAFTSLSAAIEYLKTQKSVGVLRVDRLELRTDGPERPSRDTTREAVSDGWWLLHITDGEPDGIMPYIEQEEE